MVAAAGRLCGCPAGRRGEDSSFFFCCLDEGHGVDGCASFSRFRFRKPRHPSCPPRLPPAHAVLSPTLTAKQRWPRRRMARWERMEGSSSLCGEGGVKRDTTPHEGRVCRWTRIPQAGKRSAPTLLVTGRGGRRQKGPLCMWDGSGCRNSHGTGEGGDREIRC